MAHYWAFDMVNGKTYIGRLEENMKTSRSETLCEVVVTETLTHFNNDDRKRSIPAAYTALYKDVAESWSKDVLDNMALYRNSDAQLIHVVKRWYLGEDIVKLSE